MRTRISLHASCPARPERAVAGTPESGEHRREFHHHGTRDRRYVCPESATLVKDLEAVRKRNEAKKDFITCQEYDEKVPFVDFIEQRLKSDPVARKILAMHETVTRELAAR